MAALTADRSLPNIKMAGGGIYAGGGIVVDYTVAASTTIYQGAFVRIDAGGDIVPCASTSVEPCLGMAMVQADNSAGADGDITCSCLVGGIIEHACASGIQADIGNAVYCTDDQSLVDLTPTNNELFGWIIAFITGTTFLIKMNFPGQVDV